MNFEISLHGILKTETGGWPPLYSSNLRVPHFSRFLDGWPRLLISSALPTRRGAPLFAFFAKGGNRRCLHWELTAGARGEEAIVDSRNR